MLIPDKLVEADEGWRRADNEHAEMRRAMSFGAAHDAETMTHQVGKIDARHASWKDMVSVGTAGCHDLFGEGRARSFHAILSTFLQ